MIKTKIKVHISYNGQVSDSFLNQLNRQVLVKIKNDFKNYIPIKTVVFFISFEKEIVQQNKLMNKSKLMQCSIGYSKFGITFFDVDLQWSSSKKIEDEFTDEDLIEILNYPSKELIISRIESWQNIISPPKIEKIVTKDYRFSIMEYSRFAEKINTTGFFFYLF